MSNCNKLPISVCILVKNEEDNLINSLPPLSIFKEVLVYDSGSTDKSLEICRNYGMKVIKGEWLGFSESRKKLFSEASQPWIFWLDADEVVTQELAEELKIKFSREIQVSGFEINRMVFFLGKWIKHGEWYPDWNIRIFRSNDWEILDREIHESVRIRGKVTRLNSLLEHHSYKNWKDREARVEKYSDLWASMKMTNDCNVTYGEEYLRAGWRFFRSYFIKLGFMDGVIGLKIAISIASEVTMKYRKLRTLLSK